MHSADYITIRGRLLDDFGETLAGRKVQVYKDQTHFLAYAKTKKSGRFKIALKKTPEIEKVNLTFRLCEEKKLAGDIVEIQNDEELLNNLKYLRERKEIASGQVSIDNGLDEIDVGDISFEKMFEKEEVPLSYYLHLAQSIGPKVSGFIHNMGEKLNLMDVPTHEELMRQFEVREVELTVENTWKMITNGICPIYFKKIDGMIVAEVNYDDYEFDKLKSLPNVSLYFDEDSIKTKPVPTLVKIEISFRETLEPSSKAEDKKTEIYTRKDLKRGLLRINTLRKSNSSFFVKGETNFHLQMGHIYPAGFAEAAHDYLQGTKIGELLLPHCNYVRKISNEFGKAAIFGDTGILNVSALSVKGIAQMIGDGISYLDPFTWRPREAMNETHYFARAQQMHYKLIREGTEEFIDTNWEQIVKEWKNLHFFFKRMHKNSPVYKPLDGISPNDPIWLDSNEIGGFPVENLPKRAKYKADDADVKAFRPVATNAKGPLSNDREMIINCFSHYIHTVTFWHSWVHISQYRGRTSEEAKAPHLYDLNFSPIALENYGDEPFGGIKIEDAEQQEQTLKIFENFPTSKYALIKNKNIHPFIRKRIKKFAKEYFAFGINIEDLAESTVI